MTFGQSDGIGNVRLHIVCEFRAMLNIRNALQSVWFVPHLLPGRSQVEIVTCVADESCCYSHSPVINLCEATNVPDVRWTTSHNPIPSLSRRRLCSMFRSER